MLRAPIGGLAMDNTRRIRTTTQSESGGVGAPGVNRRHRYPAVVTAIGLALLGTASVASAASVVIPPNLVVSPIGPGAPPVSFDGRWFGGVDTMLDRTTGVATPVATSEQAFLGFVRDNPRLRLIWDAYPKGGRYLVDASTGVSKRIDTDSRGAPLVPAWTGTDCQEGCEFYELPRLNLSPAAVSRDGRKVAFCSNYVTPTKPVLYVKDLVTGALKRTPLLCDVHRVVADMGVGDEFQGEFMGAAQISDDGRVVHVNGDRRDAATATYWAGDSLYFVKTGKVRHVNGWGSMTRDGGTIFLRVGVRALGAKDRTDGRVGAYNVKTKKVTRLSGRGKIYGTDAFAFSAVDQASRRGRFVVNDRVVVDRKYGLKVDVTALIRSRGYQISGDFRCCTISGDGQVVVAPVVVDRERSAWVAVTGWQPPVRVNLRADAAESRLLIDVDPHKGSGYWTFAVQRAQADGSWATLRSYRTKGRAETRTIDLPAGTYRVVVAAKYGYQGATSGEMTLVK